MKKINNKWYTDKQYLVLLEKRIQKIKEDYDILDKFDDKNIDDYEKLEEENKKLEEKNKTFEDYNKDLNRQIDKLEERIDKAIEYIEKNKQIGMFADLRKDGTHQYTIECDADDLLKILKGEK